MEPRYTLPTESYLRTTLLPEMYNTMCLTLSQVLASASYVSVATTCLRGSGLHSSKDSVLGVTAHWIDDQWHRQSAALAAHVVSDDCLDANQHHAARLVQGALVKWDVTAKVHAVFCETGKKLVSVLRESGVPSVIGFSNVLQRCVDRAVRCQPSVVDALAIARQVASHFESSVLALDGLEKIQSAASNRPVTQRLVLDVSGLIVEIIRNLSLQMQNLYAFSYTACRLSDAII